mmetsp:Transcript_31926/g.87438  ORF Transcript_31926/g.87438 Transcript_31926/m.87438 type:complete len:521 (-) Transcript_31926:351-1913(-)
MLADCDVVPARLHDKVVRVGGDGRLLNLEVELVRGLSTASGRALPAHLQAVFCDHLDRHVVGRAAGGAAAAGGSDRRLSRTESNVLSYGGSEDGRLLRHDADVVAHPLVRQRGEVGTSDYDDPGGGVVEAEEQLEHCRLAAAARPHEGGDAVGSELEAQPLERVGAPPRVQRLARLVRKEDVSHGDVGGGFSFGGFLCRGEEEGLLLLGRARHPSRLIVQHPQSRCCLRRARLRVLERIEGLVDRLACGDAVHGEGEQLAAGQLPIEDVPPGLAQHENGRAAPRQHVERVPNLVDEDFVSGQEERFLHLRFILVAHQRLVPKRLDAPHGGEVLRCHAQRHAKLKLHLPCHSAHNFTEDRGDQTNDRGDRHADGGQPWRRDQHVECGDDERARVHEYLGKLLRDGQPDCLHVRREDVGEGPCGLLVEEGDVAMHQRTEEAHAHSRDGALPRPCQKKFAGSLRDSHEGEKNRQAQHRIVHNRQRDALRRVLRDVCGLRSVSVLILLLTCGVAVEERCGDLWD